MEKDDKYKEGLNSLIKYKEGKLDYRSKLLDGAIKSNEAFDKTLVLVSSGGLVLSLTFVDKFSGEFPASPWLLIIIWISFGITLILSLISSIKSSDVHTQADKANDEIISDIDTLIKFYGSVGKNTSIEARDKAEIEDLRKKINDKVADQTADIVRMNEQNHKVVRVSFYFLIAGAFFLLLFATISILNSNLHPSELPKQASQEAGVECK